MWPFKKIESFGVELQDGQVVFFKANRARIRPSGRLVFLSGLWMLEGAVNEGEWVRMTKGIAREDLE